MVKGIKAWARLVYELFTIALVSSLFLIEKVEFYNARLFRAIWYMVNHSVTALLHDIIARGRILENLIDFSVTLISYDQFCGLNFASKAQLRDNSFLEVFDLHLLAHCDVKCFEHVELVFSFALLVFLCRVTRNRYIMKLKPLFFMDRQADREVWVVGVRNS